MKPKRKLFFLTFPPPLGRPGEGGRECLYTWSALMQRTYPIWPRSSRRERSIPDDLFRYFN
ncbi:MAG: hypothetical protein IT308_07010 [Anaerolineaceae bacterium]|nr:hypothetical protein [Anaerolineaceae bacterium]